MSLNGSVSRRDFVKTTAVGGAAVAFSPLWASGKPPDDPRPNILLITTDQQHARMMSCAGELHVNTPNLDKLAAGGVRFENAYCANPVCVPSRYSMISGHMPHVFDGLETNRKGGGEKPVIAEYVSTPTMGAIFKEAGYETLYGGKLHVEGHQAYAPEQEATFQFRSFTTNQREKLAQKAVEEFRKDREKPFLMWASFINPHDICYFPPGPVPVNEWQEKNMENLEKLHRRFPNIPLPPLPDNHELSGDEIEWVEAFQKGLVSQTGLNASYGDQACKWETARWREYRWAYRRYMEIVDAEIGILLQGLKDAGLEENTIVVFTSDHGDHDGAHQLTMKRSFYEESANIPLIIRWKGHCEPGAVDASTLVNNGPDLIPTLCDLAGIEVPKGLKGVSFRPAAEGNPIPRDFIVGQTNTGRMLRTAHYKYNVYHINGHSEEQLFDMRNDRTEQVNLARKETFAEVLTSHREKLRDWVSENNDRNGKKYLATLS